MLLQKEEPSIYHQMQMPSVPTPESLKSLYDVCRETLKAENVTAVGRTEVQRRLLDEDSAIVEVWLGNCNLSDLKTF